MAVKKTIAIVEATGLLGVALANKLAQENYRLLLISKEQSRLVEIVDNITNNIPGAEIQAINCAKDGCWEADIIILGIGEEIERTIVKKIKEVATQKIVVCISSDDSTTLFVPNAAKELQQLLPHSKVMHIFNDPSTQDLSIAGNDEESVEIIIHIAEEGGIHLKKAGNLSALSA